MRELPPDQLTFTPLPGEMPRGRLVIGDHEADLSGVRIEAAYALDRDDPVSGYLVFASDDLLYEDVLSITLTDPELQIRDKVWIGAPYDSALWTGARIVGPGRVEFSLAGDDIWRLTVLSRPQWRLPLPGAGGWVWQGLNWRRQFRIERAAASA